MGLRDEYISYGAGMPVERVIDMSVGDMVELAKAGVKVELAGRVALMPCTAPTPPKPVSYDRIDGPDLTEMIRQRWRLSRMASDHQAFETGPQLCAIRHEEKIYVFIYGYKAAPEIVVDDVAIFPSDALLARIHLMMQYAK